MESNRDKKILILFSLLAVLVVLAFGYVIFHKDDYQSVLSGVPSDAKIAIAIESQNGGSLKNLFLDEEFAERCLLDDRDVEVGYFVLGYDGDKKVLVLKDKKTAEKISKCGFYNYKNESNGYYYFTNENINWSDDLKNFQNKNFEKKDVYGWFDFVQRDFFAKYFGRDRLLGYFDINNNSGFLNFEITFPEIKESNWDDFEVSSDSGFFDKSRDRELLFVKDAFGFYLEDGGVFYGNLFSWIKKDFPNLNQEYFLSYLDKRYSIDDQMLNTFFKHPFLVYLENKNKEIFCKEDSVEDDKYNFSFVYDYDDNEDEEKFVDMIKNILKSYLSFRYPIERSFVLSDGSEGRELVADGSQVVFEKEKVEGGQVEFVDQGDHRFYFFYNDQRFIFATNENLFQNVLNIYSSKKEKDEDRSFLKSDAVFDAEYLRCMWANIPKGAVGVESDFWKGGMRLKGDIAVFD